MARARSAAWRPLAAAALLAGCGAQELYGRVGERQANEMVALLRNAGLDADKESRESETFAVTTARGDFARAVELLHAHGYPRDSFDTIGQVFKKEGFVSSPLEERARLMHALSQEMANTIGSIDGVVMARVHLSVPEKDPLAQQARPAVASVFIKHRPGRDLSQNMGQIKSLVVNSVEGLPYDNVTVALFPAEPWPGGQPAAGSARAGADTPLIVAAGGGGAAAALGVAAMVGWRRRTAAAPARQGGKRA
ncbi:type III secretion inner membrane ring lipoprotein SctJ [Schlegelella sp. S2-27]|uniref:Lipoprotein n=1 Tax=Caldimonas mangrovi TaxID=2944811 RepID=A0ABT0YIP7_9BURK|nr:type III secretion inner membrane ring lipoprotein SctJ [Caldimonas mangrovi]MCM5678259.1 type III secretion inner membrane ring lipoprotein SctJ [Caldimonas mangrovi]